MPLLIIEKVQYLKSLIFKHSSLSIVILFIFGCSSISQNQEQNPNNMVNIDQNFKIEGKFKLSFMDSKETGYFELDKNLNTVSLTVGKNYLLPEEVLIFDIRDKLDLDRFLSVKNYENEIQEIPVKYLLELCLGLKTLDFQYGALKINLEYKNLNKKPSRVDIYGKDFELSLLVRKIWKS